MKSIFNRIMAAALTIGLPLAISSCKQEDEAKDATISLEITGTTTESITFEITTENAATYSYAFAKSAEIGAAEYVTEQAQNGSAVKIEKRGLEAETEYTVKSYATNADGKECMEAVETATTTSAASVKIETVSIAPESITFRLVPMNAVSVSYAVAGPEEDVETMELPNRSEGGEQQEFTEDGLSEDTNYTIVATATNASGEESKRAYRTVKTDISPVVEILSVVPESGQASVTVSTENAAQFAWAYSEKGADVPSRESFSKVNATGENKFIISPLEESTEYTVYVYGISAGGYEGEIISEDFTTTEYVELPFEITVSNITSTDADITVTFDEELYSSYYFVAGSSDWITDITNYDFEKEYSGWGGVKPKIYSEDLEIRISEFQSGRELSLEGLYYIGGVPVKEDGTVDKDATVWRQATLSPLEFGNGSVTAEISNLNAQMSSVSFTYEVDNPDNLECVYIKCQEASLGEDNVVRAALKGPWTDFTEPAKDTLIEYLNPSTEYYLAVVAKDKEGNLNKTVHSFTMKSVTDQGDATAQISGPEMSMSEAVFDVTLDPGTEKVLYVTMIKDESYSEETLLNRLKVNNFNAITESGEFKASGLKLGTDYVFGFCAVAEDGTYGKHYIIEGSTLPLVFDGNQDAKVEVRIDNVQPGAFYGYNVWFTVTPNEQVSEYYYTLADADTESYLDEEYFVNQCLDGFTKTPYTGTQSFTGYNDQGEMCGPKAEIWILIVDQEGKFTGISKTQIDQTGW